MFIFRLGVRLWLRTLAHVSATKHFFEEITKARVESRTEWCACIKLSVVAYIILLALRGIGQYRVCLVYLFKLLL